jgi:hypothetical protein
MSVHMSGEAGGWGRHWTEKEAWQLAAELSEAGFSADEIEPWVKAKTYVSVASRASDAVHWHMAGFSSADAVNWDEAMFDHIDAGKWAAAGFSPLEAEYARDRVLEQCGGDVYWALETEAVWRSTSLIPLWVCRCLGAGVQSVAEAQAKYRESQSDSTVIGTLRFLAGLGGCDFTYLERA